MVVKRQCSFCAQEIEPGTGSMYVKRDGTVFHFCTSSCRKQQLLLGRVGHRFKWTRAHAIKLAADRSSAQRGATAPRPRPGRRTAPPPAPTSPPAPAPAPTASEPASAPAETVAPAAPEPPAASDTEKGAAKTKPKAKPKAQPKARASAPKK